ncbi:hypothetical protein HATV-3_gp5 [Haloarcula tailed virus 3]|uniref:Uncharacterized protein n=1 Tax=Haloarcula tailed virus 3 TaxID=2877990 RepID=A0AAE8XZ51_9CAUD|nr:hypothetical protein M1M35_gp05 [Haloarcula tailed virus 3]UBF23355.1 hypothetical protein HATV-3_gp5 [Haloarcula tailed virus 3]
MKDVRQSEYDHQLVLDVPNIIARQIRDMCREHEHKTQAQKARYEGLANMIEQELENQQ